MNIRWTETQQKRLSDLMNDPSVTISYWCSDQNGMPANGGFSEAVYPGMIQEVSGPLQICTEKALHATTFPHKWKGSRVWIVALFGEVQKRDDKFGSLKREIIGDILPEECLDDSIGARIGRKDLSGANLYRANLSGADLSGAYLSGSERSVSDRSESERSESERSESERSESERSESERSESERSGSVQSESERGGSERSGSERSVSDRSESVSERGVFGR